MNFTNSPTNHQKKKKQIKQSLADLCAEKCDEFWVII